LSSTAVKKTGVAMKKNAKPVIARSVSWYFLIAPTTPASTPTTAPMIEPRSSSRRLTRARDARESLMSPPVTVLPKSPWSTTPVIHSWYRPISGSLSLTP
jgi:hypothetical protein